MLKFINEKDIKGFAGDVIPSYYFSLFLHIKKMEKDKKNNKSIIKKKIVGPNKITT